MENLFTYRLLFFNLHFYKSTVSILLLTLLCLNGKTQSTIVLNDSVSTMVNNLDPGQTIKKINIAELQFTKAKDNRINFGLTGCEYHFILLKINAAKPVPDQYLSIDNTSLDTVTIYRIYPNNQSTLLYQGGVLVKYNMDRNYVWHSVAVEISNIPSYYLIAAKASQKNINIKYEINNKNILRKKYEKYERFVFFYIGVTSMIAAIIFIAFFLFKNKVFGTYLGYIACMSIWIVSHYGELFPFLYPNLPAINHIVKPVSSLGAGVFMLLVLQDVFRENLSSMKRLSRVLKGMQYILVVLTSLMFLLLIDQLNTVVKAFLITVWHLGLILSIGIIVYTPLRYIRSNTLAKIFSLAMLVVCIMAVAQLLSNSGIVADYFINEHGMAMASLLENSIMAFGLFFGLLEERKNKEKQVLALEEERKQTLKKLITVQDIERTRIANDLHDNIGPLLAALKINFNRIINSKENANGLVKKTESIIDDSILEIRDIAHNLVPKGITSKGLINALKDYFESLEPLCKKNIIFNHDVQSIFQPELQVNLYRIICELVLNAVKHSNAGLISVSLTAGKYMIAVSVFDNGQGFCLDKRKNSLGLQSAESRVHYLKGKFNLKSEPGRGTAINIEVPL